MSKKILDAAVTVIFCTCLIVSSNIPETGADSQKSDGGLYTESVSTAADGVSADKVRQEMTENTGSVTAGVCRVFFQQSFTTESDEKTGIEKKQNFRVTSPADGAGASSAPEQDKEPLEVEDQPAATEVVQQTYKNRWNVNLTEEEIELLAKIVWLEANGEPTEGQEAVVEVIFNRMTSDLYPDTLYDVLSQRNPVQFCSWKSRERAKPTEKEYQSIYQVLNGNTSILRNDTLYFSTVALTPGLDVRIGGHSFCY